TALVFCSVAIEVRVCVFCAKQPRRYICAKCSRHGTKCALVRGKAIAIYHTMYVSRQAYSPPATPINAQ
ncbi:hypothetical protein BCR44DRAFT_1431412, partial [Catenaria anguillulae PL171]